MINNWLLIIKEFINILNTRYIFYKGGLISYSKFIKENEINIRVKLIYMVGINQSIISTDEYTLSDKLTFKVLITGYREMIDELNIISKK